MRKFLRVLEFFLLALSNRFVTCSLKFNFLSIAKLRSFSESKFYSIQAGSENFVFMSRLDRK